MTSSFERRYLDPCRDISEHADWMTSILSKGHTLFLVGGDLTMLKKRIRYPLTYWREGFGRRTLRLWLAAKALGVDLELVSRRKMRPDTHYVAMPDGTVRWGSWTEMVTVMCAHKLESCCAGDLLIMNSSVIPAPGARPNCMTGIPDDTMWLKSTVLNENSIEIVCPCQSMAELMTPCFTAPSTGEQRAKPLPWGWSKCTYPIRYTCLDDGPTLPYVRVQDNGWGSTAALEILAPGQDSVTTVAFQLGEGAAASGGTLMSEPEFVVIFIR
jgi:hypothetical protein